MKKMHDYGIANEKSINSFVTNKMKRFASEKRCFETLFEFMFSERENIFFEKSAGYRIEKITYGQAYDKICNSCGKLKEKLEGIEHNSIIGLYMENSSDWILCFWSILKAGFRPILLNTRTSDEVIEQLIKTLDVKAVITEKKRFNSCNCFIYNEFINDDERNIVCNEEFGTEILFMSSGTTNIPKVCAYSAEELYWQITDSYNIISQNKLMKRHYNDRLKQLTFLPFYHVFGFIAVYLWFGFFSRTFVHLNDFSPRTLLNTIRRHEVTHIFAVPLFWEIVYNQTIKGIKERGDATWEKFQKGMKISDKLSCIPFLEKLFAKIAFKEIRENLFGDSISFMITGGSQIQPDVLNFFNSIGYRLANGYGMTEIGITSLELSDYKKTLSSGSVGAPFSSIEYKINEAGELLAKGKSLAKYIILGNEKEERPEWFNTKDISEEKSGHYKILGRQDDLIIGKNGENLNPNIIEPLFKYPCTIVATKGLPAILVSLTGFVTKSRYDNAQTYMENRIKEVGLLGQVGEIVFISDSFLTDNDFKKNRIRIQKDFESGALNRITSKSETVSKIDNEISEYIRHLFSIASEINEDEIGLKHNFFTDLGCSSLEYFALMSQIEDAFNITMPLEFSDDLCTVEKISLYVEKQISDVD